MNISFDNKQSNKQTVSCSFRAYIDHAINVAKEVLVLNKVCISHHPMVTRQRFCSTDRLRVCQLVCLTAQSQLLGHL